MESGSNKPFLGFKKITRDNFKNFLEKHDIFLEDDEISAHWDKIIKNNLKEPDDKNLQEFTKGTSFVYEWDILPFLTFEDDKTDGSSGAEKEQVNEPLNDAEIHYKNIINVLNKWSLGQDLIEIDDKDIKINPECMNIYKGEPILGAEPLDFFTDLEVYRLCFVEALAENINSKGKVYIVKSLDDELQQLQVVKITGSVGYPTQYNAKELLAWHTLINGKGKGKEILVPTTLGLLPNGKPIIISKLMKNNHRNYFANLYQNNIPENFSLKSFLVHNFYRVLLGLSYIHSQHIFHGDLATDNLLIIDGPNGDLEVYINDFEKAEKIDQNNKTKKVDVDDIDNSRFFNYYFISHAYFNSENYTISCFDDIFAFKVMSLTMIAEALGIDLEDFYNKRYTFNNFNFGYLDSIYKLLQELITGEMNELNQLNSTNPQEKLKLKLLREAHLIMDAFYKFLTIPTKKSGVALSGAEFKSYNLENLFSDYQEGLKKLNTLTEIDSKNPVASVSEKQKQEESFSDYQKDLQPNTLKNNLSQTQFKTENKTSVLVINQENVKELLGITKFTEDRIVNFCQILKNKFGNQIHPKDLQDITEAELKILGLPVILIKFLKKWAGTSVLDQDIPGTITRTYK